ncbi:ATP synthase subunit I [Ectothiorhodospira sp. BSL-9]|uniref:ATP synthase subunit I n=1 Tax=Ectothiorhodospira sp. BSL-9 TaxID=1442136 RepID=UPI001F0B4F01|nr:ATP synthase subunit I [Ectothiorhodospira sp. BSL-9]
MATLISGSSKLVFVNSSVDRPLADSYNAALLSSVRGLPERRKKKGEAPIDDMTQYPLAQARLWNRATKLILGLQLLVAGLGYLGGYLAGGSETAWAALVGGLISFISTAYFAFRVFSGRRGRPAKTIVRSFYVGETQKIFLTVALFVVAIVWLEVEFLPMFLTYMAGLMAFWLALLPVMSGANE